MNIRSEEGYLLVELLLYIFLFAVLSTLVFNYILYFTANLNFFLSNQTYEESFFIKLRDVLRFGKNFYPTTDGFLFQGRGNSYELKQGSEGVKLIKNNKIQIYFKGYTYSSYYRHDGIFEITFDKNNTDYSRTVVIGLLYYD